jgi:hypothetical protein
MGGVPEMQGAPEEPPAPIMEEVVSTLSSMTMDAPPSFSIGAPTDEEHVSLTCKRRVMKENACRLHKSERLKAKEEPNFEHPADKATRVQ